MYLIIYHEFRHLDSQHQPARLSSIKILENVNINNVKKMEDFYKSSKKIKILNFDCFHDNFDKFNLLIKKYFLSNFFIVILTSFIFVDSNMLIKEIRNKSSIQFLTYQTITCNTLFNVPFYSIYFNLFKLSLKNNKINIKIGFKPENKIDLSFDQKKTFNYFRNCNENKFFRKKSFFNNILNLGIKNFQNIYQIFITFYKYAKPIFYSNLKLHKCECKKIKGVNNCCVYSNKRRKRSVNPLPNVYQIDKLVFDNFFSFFHELKKFKFEKICNLKLLKRERLSYKYNYISITEMDQIFFQLIMLDKCLGTIDVTKCSNRLNVFDILFEKIKFDYFDQFNTKQTTFYGYNPQVNLYSKKYMLNKFLKKNQKNIKNKKKINFLNIKEYHFLKQCLQNNTNKTFEELNSFCQTFIKNKSSMTKKCNKISKPLNIKYLKDKEDVLFEDTIFENKLKKLLNKEHLNSKTYCNTHLKTESKIVHYNNRSDFLTFNRKQNNICDSLRNIKEFELEIEIEKILKKCQQTWYSFVKQIYNKYSTVFKTQKFINEKTNIFIAKEATRHLTTCKCLSFEKYCHINKIVKTKMSCLKLCQQIDSLDF